MGVADTARYVYEGLRGGYDDPFWWRERFLEFLVAPVHTSVYPTRRGAIDVMAADWDTLVVLDACRADLFEERQDGIDLDGYRTVRSRGSTTREWVRQNFSGGRFGDTVYVTANPYVSMEAGDSFHRLYEPWIDEFDPTVNTVRPEATVAAGRRAHERHPDKRVVVHLMQPHHPFIPRPDLQFGGWQISEFDGWRDDVSGEVANADGGPTTPWEALAKGHVERDDLWAAYRANLDLALGHVADLLAAVDGRVVVTSDHGNMFGERTFPVPVRVYGHPVGIRDRELVEVPWAVVEGERRDVVDEGTASSGDADADTVERRLEALGYR